MRTTSKLSPITAVLTLALLVPFAPAHAGTAVLNAACTQLGATEMSADRTFIAACVLNTPNSTPDAALTVPMNCANYGGCKWKSMSGGSEAKKCYTIGAKRWLTGSFVNESLTPVSGFTGGEALSSIVTQYHPYSGSFPGIYPTPGAATSWTNPFLHNPFSIKCNTGLTLTTCTGAGASSVGPSMGMTLASDNGCLFGFISGAGSMTCCSGM